MDQATADGAETPAELGSETPRDGTPGRRVVLAIYTASIATAALFGAVLGFVLDTQGGPTVGGFGPVAFALTPLNLAIFGIVVVGLLLTAGLLLVRAASQRVA